MKVDLDKKDLVSLVLGIVPSHNVTSYPLISKHGNKGGSFHHLWYWNKSSLETCIEEELFEIYQICKESHNESI